MTVAALIDWEIWSRSDPRLDLAWFLFFTEEAEHPMAMNPGPTGMPTAQALLDAYVGESAPCPRTSSGSTAHPVQGGGRDRTAHEAGVKSG